MIHNAAFLMMAVSVMVYCVGCGGGSGSANSGGSSSASSSIKLGDVASYDNGVSFAAPQGWESAKRQGKIIVKFDSNEVDGQSVFVKNPVPAEIETLKTVDDAKNSGLKGDLVKIGDYMWMKIAQRSRDPKTEDKFDNLNCTTVQFGKEYTVTVRGFEDQNPNSEAIMNAVLGSIKFSNDTVSEPAAVIDENTDFNVEF